MIRILVTRDHQYTFKSFFSGSIGRRDFECDVVPYDRFLLRRRVPRATYVFADLERLAPWELQPASEAYAALKAAECRVVNDPARVMTRYELLRELNAAEINDFEVFRADEHRMPSRYPVFLRFDQNHNAPISDMIETPEALAAALDELPDRGIARRSVLIVGFRGEEFEPRLYRKYSTFRIGDAVIAHHIVYQSHWVAKHGDRGVTRPLRLYEAERTFVEQNVHAGVLSRAFQIANIEYGRADYSVVSGRVQIYEINTNPVIGPLPPGMPSFRIETLHRSNRKLLDAFAALDMHSAGQVHLDLPSFRSMGRRRRLRDFIFRATPRP